MQGMESKTQHFIFIIDDQRYATAVCAVAKVIRAVELNSIPQADVCCLLRALLSR